MVASEPFPLVALRPGRPRPRPGHPAVPLHRSLRTSSVLGNGDTASALFLRRLRHSGTSPVVSRFVSAEPPRPFVSRMVTIDSVEKNELMTMRGCAIRLHRCDNICLRTRVAERRELSPQYPSIGFRELNSYGARMQTARAEVVGPSSSLPARAVRLL